MADYVNSLHGRAKKKIRGVGGKVILTTETPSPGDGSPSRLKTPQGFPHAEVGGRRAKRDKAARELSAGQSLEVLVSSFHPRKIQVFMSHTVDGRNPKEPLGMYKAWFQKNEIFTISTGAGVLNHRQYYNHHINITYSLIAFVYIYICMFSDSVCIACIKYRLCFKAIE